MVRFPTAARRALVALLLVAPAGAGLVACGRDKVPAHLPVPTQAEYASYCFRSLETTAFPQPDLGTTPLSPAEQATILKAYGAGLLAQAKIMQAQAPDELEADVDVVVDAIAQVSQSGDLSLLEGERVRQARTRLHAFEAENCGWDRQEVDAVEYAFQNVPPKLEEGPWSFHLTNKGVERHELILLRVNDNVADTGPEILATPQELAYTKVHRVGSAWAEPGEDAYVVASLFPGRYLMVCYLPVAGTGVPHVTRGMSADVVVDP